MRTSPARRVTGAGVAKPTASQAPARSVVAGASAVAIATTLAAPPAIATPLEQRYPWDVVGRALSAVVNISVIRVVGTPSKVAGQPREGHVGEFAGSGVTIAPSDAIVTNKQVINDTIVVRVTFKGVPQVPAQLIAACRITDLAVLKVPVATSPLTLSFLNRNAVEVGDHVFAVGSPMATGMLVTSAAARNVESQVRRSGPAKLSICSQRGEVHL